MSSWVPPAGSGPDQVGTMYESTAAEAVDDMQMNVSRRQNFVHSSAFLH